MSAFLRYFVQTVARGRGFMWYCLSVECSCQFGEQRAIGCFHRAWRAVSAGISGAVAQGVDGLRNRLGKAQAEGPCTFDKMDGRSIGTHDAWIVEFPRQFGKRLRG